VFGHSDIMGPRGDTLDVGHGERDAGYGPSQCGRYVNISLRYTHCIEEDYAKCWFITIITSRRLRDGHYVVIITVI